MTNTEQSTVAQDPAPRMKIRHPRLMALPERVARAKARVVADPVGQRWALAVQAQADTLLTTPPIPAHRMKLVRQHLEDPEPAAGKVLQHVQVLGLAFLWWQKPAYAARLLKELENAASYPDWNPDNFVDVGDMCRAFALGYDWLYAQWTESQRKTLRHAMVTKGLQPGQAAFASKAPWTTYGYGWNLNWNLVCNGGLVLAALAIEPEEPAIARDMLDLTLPAIAQGFRAYEPSGGWLEGPGYWCKATDYAATVLDSLSTARPDAPPGFGTADGFHRTGEFLLQMCGPTSQLFNFADSDPVHSGYPWLFYLARQAPDSTDAWVELSRTAPPSPIDLLWFDPESRDPVAAQAPLISHCPVAEVAALRSAWNDAGAVYLGIKGGDSGASDHCHLDLGSFVLDAGGSRFALDLGEDAYSLPGYFDRRQRFGYYRTGTLGHNTLVINGANQVPMAKAKIIAVVDRPGFAVVAIDLDAAYAGAARVLRIAALFDQSHVVVLDLVEPLAEISVTWQMHTAAAVELFGVAARLTLGATVLTARCLNAANAGFAVQPAFAAPPQNPNTGVSRLMLAAPSVTRKTEVGVSFSPANEAVAASALDALRLFAAGLR